MKRLLLLAALFLAVPALAQDAPSLAPDAPRLLHSADVDVKGPDGQPAVYRFRTIYDPVAGTYTRTVEDLASGEQLRNQVQTTAMIGPTPEEQQAATRLIREDLELAAVIAGAEVAPEVQGGFPFLREAEAGFCGPGSRCFQYDIFEILPGQRDARRLRYVVVDMRHGEVVARDLDPAWEGNLANPAIRRVSRARDVVFPSDSE